MLSKVKLKQNAEKELNDLGFVFDWLTDVKSNFDIDRWEEAKAWKLKHSKLFMRKVSKNHYRRVIQTPDNNFYYLTIRNDI